eukprot:15483038-Alexandrium_andersonii.AAC.1
MRTAAPTSPERRRVHLLEDVLGLGDLHLALRDLQVATQEVGLIRLVLAEIKPPGAMPSATREQTRRARPPRSRPRPSRS